MSNSFTYIDLFAGIGGIKLPFHDLGGTCVFASEIDKFARQTYISNFGDGLIPSGDITKISTSDIPNHDILLAGFPCQAFSQAGLQKGFYDTRGTLFFEIQRILVAKRPKMFLLENVKRLTTHDNGNTFKTICDILTGNYSHDDLPIEIQTQLSDEVRQALKNKLNYHIFYKVLNAKDFGVPQNRERIFIVGIDKDWLLRLGIKNNYNDLFSFPTPKKGLLETRLGDILETNRAITDGYTLSDTLWAGHQRRKKNNYTKNGFGYRMFNKDSVYVSTMTARYGKDGTEILLDQSELGLNPRKLTLRECARLQGFPESFILDTVSKTQMYKQLGNSVCVKVIDGIAKNMIDCLNRLNNKS